MEAGVYERLVVIMRLMAERDMAAVFMLYNEFGAPIAAAVRRHLAAVGVQAAPRDEVDGLVIEACLELYDCAPAWDPNGGALPWTWAERRLRTMVSRMVGQHADDIDEAVADVAEAPLTSAADEPDPLDVLRRSPARLCSLLADAMAAVGSDRDGRLLLEVGLQQSLGDPSPAHTVGARFGMQPAAVRQAVKRMKDKLRALAAVDDRYADLAAFALLA